MERPACQAKITRQEDRNDHLDIAPRSQTLIIDCGECPVQATLRASTQNPVTDVMKLNRDARNLLGESCELGAYGETVIAPDGLKPNGDPAGTLPLRRAPLERPTETPITTN